MMLIQADNFRFVHLFCRRFCEARGPAARCPLCRSGTTKALFRPFATVDSQCRDFVPFCFASGNRQAHLCASSSATQGWLTTTQPERQIWASIASPLRIYVSLRKAKEQARFVGGQRKLPRRGFFDRHKSPMFEPAEANGIKSCMQTFYDERFCEWRVPDFCAGLGEELRAV